MSLSEHFSIKNIPYGIASSKARPQKAVATRIHEHVVFLKDLPLGISEELKQAIDQVKSPESDMMGFQLTRWFCSQPSMPLRPHPRTS